MFRSFRGCIFFLKFPLHKHRWGSWNLWFFFYPYHLSISCLAFPQRDHRLCVFWPVTAHLPWREYSRLCLLFSFFSLFLPPSYWGACVCCMYMYTRCTCMHRPEDNLRYHCLESVHLVFFFFWDRFSLALGLQIYLGWLACESWGAFCLYLPNAGIAMTHCNVWLFCGIWVLNLDPYASPVNTLLIEPSSLACWWFPFFLTF